MERKGGNKQIQITFSSLGLYPILSYQSGLGIMSKTDFWLVWGRRKVLWYWNWYKTDTKQVSFWVPNPYQVGMHTRLIFPLQVIPKLDKVFVVDIDTSVDTMCGWPDLEPKLGTLVRQNSSNRTCSMLFPIPYPKVSFIITYFSK